MKFLLSLLLFCLTLSVSAADNRGNLGVEANTTAVILADINDRGRKNKRQKRKSRRINKKRKRKCSQFGKKVYAG